MVLSVDELGSTLRMSTSIRRSLGAEGYTLDAFRRMIVVLYFGRSSSMRYAAAPGRMPGFGQLQISGAHGMRFAKLAELECRGTLISQSGGSALTPSCRDPAAQVTLQVAAGKGTRGAARRAAPLERVPESNHCLCGGVAPSVAHGAPGVTLCVSSTQGRETP